MLKSRELLKHIGDEIKHMDFCVDGLDMYLLESEKQDREKTDLEANIEEPLVPDVPSLSLSRRSVLCRSA